MFWIKFKLREIVNLTSTRMHSSRMRTGRALTVSGGGGVHPRRIFWGEKKLKKKKKEKKIWRNPPPENFRPPRKIGDPPKISDPPKIGDTPRDQTHPPKFQTPPGTRPPPLLTESQTRVKILPWPNFVAAGKNWISYLHYLNMFCVAYNTICILDHWKRAN